MQGTYIASQLDKDNSIHSVITFDLGGEWHPLTKPEGTKCRDDAKVQTDKLTPLFEASLQA